ncbi:hypothetical protein BT96DRAFT_494869 [Gymnopus androsaceus JB14]|uniref:Uncharacterized protein n=1 Tax=Gymnopus androsaceus JB14 TaxID=1447944 RepID=A0A6A4I3G7_9AGAR|nr:hypothetical protein BT96DRAFT_494869 [Gymnopus androsaceus JB14]
MDVFCSTLGFQQGDCDTGQVLGDILREVSTDPWGEGKHHSFSAKCVGLKTFNYSCVFWVGFLAILLCRSFRTSKYCQYLLNCSYWMKGIRLKAPNHSKSR